MAILEHLYLNQPFHAGERLWVFALRAAGLRLFSALSVLFSELKTYVLPPLVDNKIIKDVKRTERDRKRCSFLETL